MRIVLIFLVFLHSITITEAYSESHSKVTLVSRFNECLSDSKDPCELGLLFELDPEWHIYWKNPGDSGAAPRFNFISPPNLKNVNFFWPNPERLKLQHLVNFGYEKKVLLPFHVYPTKDNKDSLSVLVKGEWLECKEDCIPQESEFSITQKLVSEKDLSSSNLIPTNYESLFSKINFPDKLSNKATSIESSLKENIISIKLFNKDFKDSTFSSVFFFPGVKSIAESSNLPSILNDGDSTNIEIQLKKSNSLDLISENLLQIDNQFFSFSIGDLIGKNNNSADGSLLYYFIFAVFGGLILNFMPCVLPVLAIKATQLINSDSKNNIKDSIFYFLGVYSSILILFLIILVIKASGASIGWGFQFQNPIFTLFCALLFLLLTLNLFEVFNFNAQVPEKINLYASKSNSVGAYFSGVLTTIISTPCTAPFAGASLAYALSTTVSEGFIIFTGLSIGLSLPFSLTYIFPKLIKCILPKPGNWLSIFKKICAIPLFATSIWLFTIFYTQINFTNNDVEYTDRWGQEWKPYSESLMDSVISNKTTAYVDFTASWCLTCQLNKQIVFSPEEVRKYIKDNNIVLIKADWTNKDPVITNALSKLNSVSVPVTLVVKNGEKIKLSTVLTSSEVLAKLS